MICDAELDKGFRAFILPIVFLAQPYPTETRSTDAFERPTEDPKMKKMQNNRKGLLGF